MPTRLILLVAMAGGLAVYFAVRSAPDTVAKVQIRGKDKVDPPPIWQRPLEGEEPPDRCEFDVTVEVDTTTGQNLLYFNITEVHGYYAESLKLRFWYSEQGKYPNEEDSPLSRGYYFDRYVPANGVLRTCFALVNAELAHIGGSIGSTGDWSASIEDYNRARVDNPATFPELEASTTCD